MTDLKNLQQSDLANILLRFDTDTPYNLEFISEPLSPNVFGTTNWKIGVLENGNQTVIPFNYLIKISTVPSQSTDLHLAQTILHELIHAHFLSLADDLLQTGDTQLQDEFPILWNWYVLNKYGGNAGSPHHETLANTYVDALSRALQEFDTGNEVPIDESPGEIYTDLAWGGLEGTTIFNEIHPPMSTSRIRIQNRLFAEAYNQTSGGIIPTGTPCN